MSAEYDMYGQVVRPVCLGIDEKSSYLGTAISDSQRILQSNSPASSYLSPGQPSEDCNK